MTEFSVPGYRPPLYNLTCVLIHSGTCAFGHYFVYVKQKSGIWFKMNDEEVRPVEEEEVLRNGRGVGTMNA